MSENGDTFDLIIIGSGSGNHIPEFLNDWRIAMVERDVFGGTCLNRGCIPSKMLVLPVDRAVEADEARPLGVDITVNGADWSQFETVSLGESTPSQKADVAIGLSDAKTSRSSREPVSLFAPKSMACMQSTLMVVESPPRTCSWRLVHGRRFHPSPGFRRVGFTRVIRSCVSTRFRHASGSSVVGTSQQKWAMCSLGSVLRSRSLTGRPRCSRVTILISQRHSLKNSDGACHSTRASPHQGADTARN